MTDKEFVRAVLEQFERGVLTFEEAARALEALARSGVCVTALAAEVEEERPF